MQVGGTRLHIGASWYTDTFMVQTVITKCFDGGNIMISQYNNNNDYPFQYNNDNIVGYNPMGGNPLYWSSRYFTTNLISTFCTPNGPDHYRNNLYIHLLTEIRNVINPYHDKLETPYHDETLIALLGDLDRLLDYKIELSFRHTYKHLSEDGSTGNLTLLMRCGDDCECANKICSDLNNRYVKCVTDGGKLQMFGRTLNLTPECQVILKHGTGRQVFNLGEMVSYQFYKIFNYAEPPVMRKSAMNQIN